MRQRRAKLKARREGRREIRNIDASLKKKAELQEAINYGQCSIAKHQFWGLKHMQLSGEKKNLFIIVEVKDFIYLCYFFYFVS